MTKSFRAFAVMALSISGAFAEQITVYKSGQVTIGQSRQLTAYVPLSPNTVTWTVNGVPGGNSVHGTISASGLYTAPAAVPLENAVSVRATSIAYPDKWHTVIMTVTQPPVQLWSVSPKTVPAGAFTIAVNGANFHAGSVVNFGDTPLETTLLSATSLRAVGSAAGPSTGASVPVTVTNLGLGGTTSPVVLLKISSGPINPAPTITVAVNPATATVSSAATRQFSANVTGVTETGVTWSVNGVQGGNASVGTITAAGLYTAPAVPPNPDVVTVRATSVVNINSHGSAAVTVQAAPANVTVAVTPPSASVAVGSAQQFAATVTGNSNVSVTWSVNGIVGGNSTVGLIGGTGLFSAPATVPTPAAVTVRATSVANPTVSATASAMITAGGGTGQGTPNLAAARFLEQAAFGPTPAALVRVNAIGVGAWLDEQFAMAESPIVTGSPSSNSQVQSQFLSRLSMAPDQLRQRVAYALSQIIVISINKNNYPNEIVPYLEILSRNAFGNYRTLLGEISVSPQMGKYLDLANSNKPTAGSAANENYARELMQLFTIGLYRLNLDGSHQLDPQGFPIRAYEQFTVQQVALALTGWTYVGPGNNNWENFSGPMQPRQVNHDTSAKVFVGTTLPAGQTAAADMAGTLDWLFNHPNVGPFLATRLIRAMVKSNPTPAYVARVSIAFNDNGAGVRGDLRAVVRAILTDPEARDDAAVGNAGRLKEPIYHVVSLLRALGGSISPTNQQAWYFSRMGQTPLAPPSVFGFYSPLFRIPRTSLAGPEFQIFGPTEAVLRGNTFWTIVSYPGSDFPWDITPFLNVAGNTVALIDAVDQTLLYGRMPAGMRQSLANAINAQSDNRNKALTALYLTSLSGLFAVQH